MKATPNQITYLNDLRRNSKLSPDLLQRLDVELTQELSIGRANKLIAALKGGDATRLEKLLPPAPQAPSPSTGAPPTTALPADSPPANAPPDSDTPDTK